MSTFGLRSSNRKISRKAIQEVNVRKACETILQPGAPIALRLQGSLLYGVSRVFSQQCSYVLTDAEKIHMHMRCFYNAMGGSENALDQQAGKAKYVYPFAQQRDRRINLTSFSQAQPTYPPG